MDKTQKQRLEQLARQGIVPSSKLPMLMQAMSSLYMGKQLKPTERNVLAKYMHNMTDIMLKDTTVFNRAKLHTQKTKYHTEETTVELDENVRVIDGEEDMEVSGREKAEKKAKRLSIRKRDKYRLLSPELKREKKKANMDEEVVALNNTYQEMFEATLEYFEVSNIRDLPEDKKKEFFDTVDEALEEAKMAKKDHDGDGKIETSTAEYMGSRDKAIKKAMGKKVKEEVEVEEGYYKDMDTNKKEDDRLAKKPAAIKLKGFGPDKAKGNMSNPAARAALMRKEEANMPNKGIEGDKESPKQGSSEKPAVGELAPTQDSNAKLKEAMSPEFKAKRLDMIRQAHDRVLTGKTRDARKAGAAARAHMKDPKATKGMARTKKDEAMEEQVKELRQMIREGNDKIGAYKLLAKILNNKETSGEL